MSDILKTEQLLEHVDFLKALARRLVGADDADDLVQDTLVSALSSPERPGSLRAWLVRIARNRSVSRWRRDHTRRDKERRSSTPPELPGPSEAAEQLELQEKVVQAVSALDEPYRSVVVQRFYYGSSMKEIAKSLGEPVETVRTRLTRAMKQLRARLDATCGGRRAWLGGLTVFAWGEAAAQSASFALSIKSVIAALLILAAGSTLWVANQASDDEEESAHARFVQTEPPAKPATKTASISPAGDEEPANGPGTLRGIVWTADHKPIEGARVRLFDVESSAAFSGAHIYWNTPGPVAASAVTGSDGSYSLGPLPLARRILLVEAEGFTANCQGVAHTDLIRWATLSRADSGLRSVRVVDEDGAAVANAEVLAVSSVTRLMPVARTRTNGRGMSTLAVPRGFSIVIRARGFAWHQIDDPKEQNEVKLKRGFVLAGTVTDETGRAIPNAWIVIRRFFFGHEPLRADAVGAFVIEGLDDKQQSLTVTAAGHSQRSLTVWPGDERMQIELAPTGAVRGKILYADGSPAVGASVMASGPTGVAKPDQAGRFTLAEVSSGRVTLIAYEKNPREPGRSLNAKVVVDVPARGELNGVEIRFATPAASSLVRGFVRIHVVDSDGRPVAGVSVWGSGSAGQKTEKDGAVLLRTSPEARRGSVFFARSAVEKGKSKTQPDIYNGWVRTEPRPTQAEADANPVKVVVRKPVSVDIVLRGPNGEAIANRTSSIRIQGLSPDRGEVLASGGARFLVHETTGPYSWMAFRLNARAVGYQAREILNWKPPAGGGVVEIRLKRGVVVRGRLVDPDGEPRAKHRIEVRPAGIEAESDADGRFVLHNLAAGSIRLVVFRGEDPCAVYRTKIGESGAKIGDWIVPDPSRIRGRVVDEQGDPVGGAKVQLPEPWGFALTRADGKFTLPFPAGEQGLLALEKGDLVSVPLDTTKLKREVALELVVYRAVKLRVRAGWARSPHVATAGNNVRWKPKERFENDGSRFILLPPLQLRLTLTDKGGDFITRELDLTARVDVDLGTIAPPE